MDYDLWMDPEVKDVCLLQPLLRPYPADWMTAYPISTRVNDPKNDDPSLLAAS
jgi:putative SOS response-associated peptidase YedK